MATINELFNKRENLLFQIAGVREDLKEYTKYPVETVDVEQIKYQYDFILREIKEIDEKLKFIFIAQCETLKTDLQLLDKQIKESVSEKKFTVTDLPKLHYSMFDEPII
jgi:hypothetical protein